jgi:hypothetical protein
MPIIVEHILITIAAPIISGKTYRTKKKRSPIMTKDPIPKKITHGPWYHPSTRTPRNM